MKTQTDTAHQLARQIMEIIPYVMRAIMAKMKQPNTLVMPAHYRLLGMLSRRSWTLKELADRIEVSPPTMSNTITTLEERGWVTRTRSEEDRRAVSIQITEEGKKILEDIHRQGESYLTKLMENLAPSEQEILAQGLSILRRLFESVLPTAKEEDPSHRSC
jgi:DNA-binding MarR family transcriptional regulator